MKNPGFCKPCLPAKKKLSTDQLPCSQFDVRLPAVGVSLVSTNEELLFARFAELSLRLARSNTRDVVQLAVADVQIDNQQVGTQSRTFGRNVPLWSG